MDNEKHKSITTLPPESQILVCFVLAAGLLAYLLCPSPSRLYRQWLAENNLLKRKGLQQRELLPNYTGFP